MDELKLVTRQETFNDLAVRELAKSQAACLCRLEYKRCTKSRCATCETHRRLTTCKGSLSDYDAERLKNYTTEYYGYYSSNPMSWMSHREYKKHFSKFLFLCILFVMLIPLLIGLCSGPFDKPERRVNYEECIVRCIQRTQINISDINQDNKVNCIDYAVIFKLTWDEEYPLLKERCQIVRNRNIKTGMNHLFVHVWNDQDQSIDIEPGAYNPYHYTMFEAWGTKYDPEYNSYGETEYWLSEVR